jgi:hypothetical protein
LSFDSLSIICTLRDLIPFRISLFLVSHIVFLFRADAFLYLEPYTACHELRATLKVP